MGKRLFSDANRVGVIQRRIEQLTAIQQLCQQVVALSVLERLVDTMQADNALRS